MTVSDTPLVDHAVALYTELQRRAELDNDGRLMFEGSVVEAFRAINVSQAYYSLLFKELTELGCIEYVRKGNRHLPSLVLLHFPPEREQLQGTYRSRLTKPRSFDTMREWVSQLEARIERLEQEVGINGSQ